LIQISGQFQNYSQINNRFLLKEKQLRVEIDLSPQVNCYMG